MNVSESMQSFCVRVNNGSGVLVNAMTQEYSYVLTAAHVLPDNLDDIIIQDCLGNPLDVLAVLTLQEWDETQEYDCAILKVTYQEQVTQKLSSATNLPNQANLTLVGFPQSEIESTAPIKFYDGHMTSVVNELVIFTINGIPGAGTIKGMSGGGVYHIENKIPLLIGIEFRMDGSSQEQQYGRVQCYSLVRFEEIITLNSSAPMLPSYLECFSNVTSEIFSFNVDDPSNVSALKQELKYAANHLIEKGLLPPYKIMELYDSDLLVDPNNLSELKTYELWVAYLEFLVISVLIDQSQEVTDVYLRGLERKRRLVYTSNDTNWIRRLEELLTTARKLLDKNGTLIVASPETTAKVFPKDFQLERVISDISVVPTKGPFIAIDSIVSSESAILASYKLTHLEGLRRECVVEVEYEYPKIQSSKRKSDFLREKLNEFIN